MHNTYTILLQVNSWTQWFSIVDLSNTFFSKPVYPRQSVLVCLPVQWKCYTWTCLPQGLTWSPTLYCDVLARSHDLLNLSPGSALLQYVDDLQIVSPMKHQCEQDSVWPLQHLADNGRKDSLSKRQVVKQQVTFLGHILTPEWKQ